MARVVLVLLLAAGFSLGVTRGAQGGPCTAGDCGYRAGNADHAPGSGDASDVGGECPAFCGGCLRVVMVVAPGTPLVPVPLSCLAAAAPPLGRPHLAPPATDLFRPPRA